MQKEFYTDGSAAHKIYEFPPLIEKEREEKARAKKRLERKKHEWANDKKRQKDDAYVAAKEHNQLSLPYVMFLTFMGAAFVFICVNYLQLQSAAILCTKQITALKAELSEMTLDNDAAYNSAIDSVDMNEVKDIAVNKLGMDYPTESQVITYECESRDYVRQYCEIPES